MAWGITVENGDLFVTTFGSLPFEPAELPLLFEGCWLDAAKYFVLNFWNVPRSEDVKRYGLRCNYDMSASACLLGVLVLVLYWFRTCSTISSRTKTDLKVPLSSLWVHMHAYVQCFFRPAASVIFDGLTYDTSTESATNTHSLSLLDPSRRHRHRHQTNTSITHPTCYKNDYHQTAYVNIANGNLRSGRQISQASVLRFGFSAVDRSFFRGGYFFGEGHYWV